MEYILSPDKNLYSQLIFNKHIRQFHRKRILFSTTGATEYSQVKTKDLYIKPDPGTEGMA